MAPIPIAFCITELDRGGAERMLTQLVLGLDRSAWTARVYCLGPRGYFADIIEAGGVPVECLNGRRLLSFPLVLRRLTRSLRSFQPALLQTFLFHGNLVGRFAGRMAGVPKIISGIRVAERRSLWYGRVDRWTNRLVDHNVCVSQGVADFSERVTGLLRSKLCVIPNGVEFALLKDATPIDWQSIGILSDSPVVITVGRLEEQKGIRFLLQAAHSVLQQFPDCKFVIVGDGPDRTSLEAIAAQLGISNAVSFVGHRTDVPALLKAATLFVLPSLWEGMPNALLEAMAVGLPSIATSVEGSRDVIQSEANGLLVDPANSDLLSGAILRLLNDRNLANRLARESQISIETGLTSHNMIGAYADLYRRVIIAP